MTRARRSRHRGKGMLRINQTITHLKSFGKHEKMSLNNKNALIQELLTPDIIAGHGYRVHCVPCSKQVV